MTHLPGAADSWTDLLIVVNVFAEPHTDDTPSDYEDLALRKLIREHTDRPGGISEISIEGVRLDVCKITTHTVHAWALLRILLSRSEYLDLRETVATLQERVLAPFPVIRPLGFASFTAETYLIWWKSKLAVCKCFRAGYNHHYATETAGLKLAAKLNIGPRVFEVGSNWIVMEYLKGYRPVRPEWYKMFDLGVVLEAFGALSKLHDAGYAHFDFNPLNVMHNASGDVKLIDFENLYERTESSDFLNQPVFSGRSFFESDDVACLPEDENRINKYRTIGPMAVYEKNWLPNVGLSPEVLIGEAVARPPRRFHYFVTNRIIGKFSRRFG